MLNFTYERIGENKEIICIPISGSLDAENCEYLLECVVGRIEAGHTKLILDCNDLDYISSMGLGMLVRVNSRMKKIGGDVKLANLHSTAAKILRLVRLDSVFQIYPSVEEALAAFESG